MKNNETLDWRVSAMETLTILRLGGDVDSDRIQVLVDRGKLQIGSGEYMWQDSVLMNRLAEYISCNSPEIYEWRRIRSWVRRHWKFDTRRFMTSVNDDGWCGIEVYSDGDCWLFGGPGPKTSDVRTPLAIHGVDAWMLPNQDALCHEIRRATFTSPMSDVPHVVIGAAFAPWILEMVADSWWRIRYLMKSAMRSLSKGE